MSDRRGGGWAGRNDKETDGKRLGPGWSDLNWDLICCSTNSSRFNLNHWPNSIKSFFK